MHDMGHTDQEFLAAGLGKVVDRIVAAALGCSKATVHLARKRLGVAPVRKHQRSFTADLRGDVMVALLLNGSTLDGVGVAYGLTRERVRQITTPLLEARGVTTKARVTERTEKRWTPVVAKAKELMADGLTSRAAVAAILGVSTHGLAYHGVPGSDVYPKAIPVICDGKIVHRSLSRAGVAMGGSVDSIGASSAIWQRLRKLGWEARRALTTPVRRRTPARLITHGGETLSAPKWSARLGGNGALVYMRLRAGWSETDAVTTPVGEERKMDVQVQEVA